MKSMSPNNLGKKFIVEEVQRLTIKDYLRNFKYKLKEVILGSIVEVLGKRIELDTTRTGFGGLRYWFKCPQCQKKVGVLFIHPLTRDVGCRTCLGLDYRKRRFKGMAEGEIT